MEECFWMSQNLKNLVMYDIGAFHGLLTLFFAQECRQVISYEPNTRNHARLIENIQLNGLKNVLVRQVGLGSKSEVVTMMTSQLMPGGASTERNTVAGLLNSGVPVLSEQISITTLDDDIHKASLPRPDFVKLDIEGGELPALVGARNTLLTYHPLLYLEMHGETMNLKIENAAAIVSCLNEFGYSEILHIESGTRITADNSFVAAEGHLYCQ
jgi:FkbM family methyltransferase